MIAYIVIGILLALMFLYIILRKPIWMKQITPQGKEVIFCSHCGHIWTPTYYSGYQLEMTPPDKCPQCKREMRVYH